MNAIATKPLVVTTAGFLTFFVCHALYHYVNFEPVSEVQFVMFICLAYIHMSSACLALFIIQLFGREGYVSLWYYVSYNE